MNKKIYTFWQLLTQKVIEIPIIQRDYAQGRKGKEYIRKNFLEQIGRAIGINSDTAEKEYTELDFVYGSEYASDKNNYELHTMYPLDGQQRLTTLWLIHWYVAYKSENLTSAKSVLQNFSYETRDTSRDFCHNLCEMKYDSETKDIVHCIMKQKWFYSAWKQDPTIQAMLRMLRGTKTTKNGKDFIDGIEELFLNTEKEKYKEIWEDLTGDNCKIVFNFLPLSSYELPLSDDLYIKMNARGKALTDMENLKADLIGWMRSENNKSIFSDEMCANISAEIDNMWTDLFWENKNEDGNIDEIFFAFLNRYFLGELIVHGKDKNNKEYSGNFLQDGTQDSKPVEFDYFYGTYYENNNNKTNNDTRIAYRDFSFYAKTLDDIQKDLKAGNSMERITTMFTNLYDWFKSKDLSEANGVNRKIAELSPEWSRKEYKNKKVNIENLDFNPSILFIPVYQGGNIENFSNRTIKSINTINITQRVVFFGLCKYFEYGKENDESLRNWLRVVWNIAENTNKDSSIAEFVSAIRIINRISPGCHDIYRYLVNDDSLNSINDAQLSEERHKAKQILCTSQNDTPSEDWENLIIDAENMAFFNGSIRFMFMNQEGNIDWNYFKIKKENANKYFYEKGIRQEYASLLTMALVKRLTSWNELVNKQIFNPNAETWKYKILCSDNEYRSALHDILTSDNLESIDYTSDFLPAEGHLRKEMCDSGLIDVLVKNHKEYRIHWNRDCHAVYKPNGGGGSPICFDWWWIYEDKEAGHCRRNYILNHLDGINVSPEHIIEGVKGLYYNYNIWFDYNSKHFLWEQRYKPNEYRIAICNDNKEIITNGTNNEARYMITFRNDQSKSVNELKSMLDKLCSEYDEDN